MVEWTTRADSSSSRPLRAAVSSPLGRATTLTRHPGCWRLWLFYADEGADQIFAADTASGESVDFPPWGTTLPDALSSFAVLSSSFRWIGARPFEAVIQQCFESYCQDTDLIREGEATIFGILPGALVRDGSE